MKVMKNSLLQIEHSRKGSFLALALQDFDTDELEFFPVAVAEQVEGLIDVWKAGEQIPCRSSFCHITATSGV